MLTYRMKRADRRGNTVLLLTPIELLARLASLIPAPRRPQRRFFGILAPRARDRAEVPPVPTHKRPCHQAKPDSEPDAVPNTIKPYAQPIPWSLLLARVFGLAALCCPKCQATMTPARVPCARAPPRRVIHLRNDGLRSKKRPLMPRGRSFALTWQILVGERRQRTSFLKLRANLRSSAVSELPVALIHAGGCLPKRPKTRCFKPLKPLGFLPAKTRRFSVVSGTV